VVLLGLYDTTTGKQVRPLGRLGLGGQYLAKLWISLDAAGQHLLAYGYPASHRVTEINLTTGRRASTTAAHLFTEGLTAAAW
jgi:YD repeat-containing protein